MSTSGGTSGTIITGGGAAGSINAQERFPRTVLAPNRYAKIIGITPPHLWQAASATIFPNDCRGVWYAHDWQMSGQVSREQLAYVLLQAEQEIAQVLGFWPAPVYIEDEMHVYPKYHRRELYGTARNIRSEYKAIEANWGKMIAAGRRATSLVGDSISVVYSDPDSDGYNERATITVTNVTEGTACEHKVYFEDKSADPQWEVREPISKTLSGTTLTIVLDAWLLIDPDLQEKYPNTNDPLEPIALLSSSSYVSQVDVYREYTDFTQASAQFSWIPKTSDQTFTCASCGGSGCAACSNTTQDGCFAIRDVDNGLVVARAATYDSDNGQWAEASWTECREPDTIKLWYYGGELSQQYLSGLTCDPLDHGLAQAIAWLATARLDRDVCGCSNVQDLVKDLRRDLALSEPDGGFYATSDEVLNNPFGSRKGEVMAWKKVKHLTARVPDLAIA